MTTRVDHLIVAARDLDRGAAWCEATFGVAPAPGGRHPTMGTHNRLLNLSCADHPQAYLEVIAVDPEAPRPPHRRWFGLDDIELDTPRLVHWVARSTMLDMHRWGAIAAGAAAVAPLSLARGPYRWRMLLSDDVARPSLIEWPADGPHPADALPASGVALRALRVGGVPPQQRGVLRTAGVEWSDEPGLEATLASPRGPITLRA